MKPLVIFSLDTLCTASVDDKSPVRFEDIPVALFRREPACAAAENLSRQGHLVLVAGGPSPAFDQWLLTKAEIPALEYVRPSSPRVQALAAQHTNVLIVGGPDYHRAPEDWFRATTGGQLLATLKLPVASYVSIGVATAGLTADADRESRRFSAGIRRLETALGGKIGTLPVKTTAHVLSAQPIIDVVR